MNEDDDWSDGPECERCDHCGRWVDACNLNPCLPPDEDGES